MYLGTYWLNVLYNLCHRFHIYHRRALSHATMQHPLQRNASHALPHCSRPRSASQASHRRQRFTSLSSPPAVAVPKVLREPLPSQASHRRQL